MIAYKIDHPRFSEPLVIESEVPREASALAAHASVYVLRVFNELIPHTEFTVEELPEGS